jgi:hypothetical protein
MFQNPMMIMMVVVGVMVLAMPYIMVCFSSALQHGLDIFLMTEKHGPRDVGRVQGTTSKDA